MYKTATIFIKNTNPLFDVIDDYAFLCKNLKNSALYAYRQAFFSNKTINKFSLINTFTHDKQADYIAIPRKVAQQIIFQVAQEFQSFWGLIKLWVKDKTKPRPNIPRYLDKQKGRANIIFTKQAISKKDLAKGELTLSPFDKSRPISIKLGKLNQLISYDNIQEVKVVKVANGYDVKICYKTQDIESPTSINPTRVLSIDFGVNNLMTVGNNIKAQNIIIKGKALKSFNQYFNKKLAKLKSHLDTTKDFLKPSVQKKLDRLYQKRKHKVNDFLHKASHYLVNHAVENHIDTLVIGYNQGLKQEIEIGRVNNQKFVNIPFATLLDMITYKAKEKGMQVIITNESHTSKCSFLDDEPIQKQPTYKGKRIKRGLFKSSQGKLINADVNGALNILRKVIGNFDYDPIQVCSTPKMVNVLK
ncbi:RNA-guided endonuclease InsQ/TnpB family protein [Moraxella oblonga]|uniref:RNA-guided endonuclease InsQ/TnpB family protein n=1 Tax=Moraxella oblonga TaxID=200413 RepID=UPI000834835F|nr:RNA-guided endonuclease TnpB family protein [Moraxella oblonga]